MHNAKHRISPLTLNNLYVQALFAKKKYVLCKCSIVMYVSSPVVLTSAGDMLCAGHVTRDTWSRDTCHGLI